jgi:hypothetical protein
VPAARFATLPPGAPLPSGDECATRVRRTGWEPRPGNLGANQTRGYRIGRVDGATEEGQSRFGGRIDGAFTGTTDEIIQWAACKWGFDEDVVRAIAVAESRWHQDKIGDEGQSVGILQVKCTLHAGACPAARESTAFNLDYVSAWRRSCFEGYFDWVPPQSRGDEWGCVGLAFSGRWGQGDADYVASVQSALARREWLASAF